IRWLADPPPDEKVPQEELERSAMFYPVKADAEEIIATWECKTSREARSVKKAHERVVVSKTSRTLLRYGWGLIIVGAGFAGCAVYWFFHYRASANWPSVQGKIVSEQIELLPTPRKRIVQDARVDLIYSYEVNGRKYTGSRYTLWGG